MTCAAHVAYNGTAKLIKANVTDSFRVLHLSDSEGQTDYVLRTQVEELRPGIGAYTVVGEPEIFVKHGELLASFDHGRPANYMHASDIQQWNGTFVSYLGAHFTYYDTKYDTHISQLQDDVTYLNCMIDNAQVLVFLAMSRISKVLVAESMELPECYASRAGLSTDIIDKCEKVQANFTERATDCIHQPEFGNFTIDVGGRALRRKTPCFWQDSITYFEESGTNFEMTVGRRWW